jgi:hypothetical protein
VLKTGGLNYHRYIKKGCLAAAFSSIMQVTYRLISVTWLSYKVAPVALL